MWRRFCSRVAYDEDLSSYRYVESNLSVFLTMLLNEHCDVLLLHCDDELKQRLGMFGLDQGVIVIDASSS